MENCIRKPVDRLFSEVVDAGLCTRCGSCVGVCPENALEFREPLGECLPVLAGACSGCKSSSCYEGCSGKEVPMPDLNRFVFGSEPDNYLYGHFEDLYVGHTTDAQIRSGGASGGILTTVLLDLLEREEVEGVLVVRMNKEEPWRSESIVATTKEEVIEAQQSKYSLSPHNVLLKEIRDRKGPFAYVGLPCQVHSLRKLQSAGHPDALKIKYVLGSFCGNMLYFDAIKSFLKSNGIRDYTRIKTLQYRAGEWPGYLQVELKDGKVFALHKFYANYLTPFYIVDRCLTCTDLTNELADLVGGDAWSPVYEERRKGWSLVCSRTPKGKELIDRLSAEGKLSLQELSYEEAVDMHCHTLDIKKRGAYIRMRFRRLLGRKNPDYGIEPVSIPVKRYLFEIFLDCLLLFGRTRLARFLVEHLPLKLVGESINFVKVRWKKITSATRKKGITGIKFQKTPNK